MISPETSAFSYTTYSAFCARVRGIAFPNGVGESQKAAFDTFLVNALIKAQRYIDCLRNLQASFYEKAQMYEHCGVAQLQGPRGRVSVVYAFKPGETCVKHFYRPCSPAHITCWAKENSCSWLKPPGIGTESFGAASDVCEAYAQLYGGTDEDDQCWKCEPKFVARGQNGEIWLAPRPPCGYIVAVHWEGLRRRWAGSDAVPDDEDLIDWVAQQVQAEMALRMDREPQFSANLKADASVKFGDLMYWCNEERILQMKIDCANGIDTGNLMSMFQPIYPYGYEMPSPTQPPEEPGGNVFGGSLYLYDPVIPTPNNWRRISVSDGVISTGDGVEAPDTETVDVSASLVNCMMHMIDELAAAPSNYRILIAYDGAITLSDLTTIQTCNPLWECKIQDSKTYLYDEVAAIVDPTKPWRELTCNDGVLGLNDPVALP